MRSQAFTPQDMRHSRRAADHTSLKPPAIHARTFSRRAAVAMLATCFLAACQTLQSIEAEFTGYTFEEVQGRLIDSATERAVPDVEPDLLTTVMDRISLKDARGEEVGFNVAERHEDDYKRRKENERERNLRQAHERGIQEISPTGEKVLTTFLESIVQNILDVWKHEKPEVDIVVSNDMGYYAHAQPNGIVTVAAGVLMQAESEDEVAAVVAHELAHILLKHSGSDEHHALEKKAFLATTSLAISQAARTNTGQDKKALLAMLAAQELGAMHSGILHQRWKRKEEDEADLLAADLLYEAGYDWESVVDFLEKVSLSEASAMNSEADYVKNLQDFAATLEEEGSLFTAMVESTKSGLGEVSATVQRITASHAPASQRRKNLNGYLDREYEKYTASVPARKTARLRKIVDSGPGLQALRKSFRAKKARALLQQEAFEEAEAFALRSLDGRKDPHPDARVVLYYIRKSEGREDLALDNLQIANRLRNPPLEVVMLLVDEYETRQDWNMALQILKKSRGRIDLDDRAYLERWISVAARAGHADEVKQALAACEKAGTLTRLACMAAYQDAASPLAG